MLYKKITNVYYFYIEKSRFTSKLSISSENSYKKTYKCEILTFVGPCIVIYFYSKTNEMRQFLKFILFWSGTLYVSPVFPPIIRSLRLYIQHQVYVKQILLTAC